VCCALCCGVLCCGMLFCCVLCCDVLCCYGVLCCGVMSWILCVTLKEETNTGCLRLERRGKDVWVWGRVSNSRLTKLHNEKIYNLIYSPHMSGEIGEYWNWQAQNIPTGDKKCIHFYRIFWREVVTCRMIQRRITVNAVINLWTDRRVGTKFQLNNESGWQ